MDTSLIAAAAAAAGSVCQWCKEGELGYNLLNINYPSAPAGSVLKVRVLMHVAEAHLFRISSASSIGNFAPLRPDCASHEQSSALMLAPRNHRAPVLVSACCCTQVR
jgi:hypothetical protein